MTPTAMVVHNATHTYIHTVSVLPDGREIHFAQLLVLLDQVVLGSAKIDHTILANGSEQEHAITHRTERE